jgi:hypothetical protein
MSEPEMDLADIWKEAFLGWHAKQAEEEKYAQMLELPQCRHQRYEHYSEGTVVCVKCGLELTSFVPQRLDYIPENYRKIPVYRRVHHFNERTSQWLCLDAPPPAELMAKCKAEIKLPATKGKIRAVLRKHKQQKYIEKWIHIFCYIGDTPTPSVCSFKLQRLRELFPLVESAFLSHKPPSRKSIISYNFIFMRLLQLLELPEHYKWFPQLKSRQKLMHIDGIWRDMCRTIGSEHTPLPASKSLR